MDRHRRQLLAAIPAWGLVSCSGSGNISAEKNTASEIAFFPVYGQSWALGFDAIPAISLHQRYNSLMFNSGVVAQSRSDDPTVAYQSLVPLTERNYVGTPIFPGQGGGETPATGQVDIVQEQLHASATPAVEPSRYQLLASAPGEGGLHIEALSKGSFPYNRLLAQVTSAQALARQAGKAFSVPALSWLHNTAATGFATDGGTSSYPALLDRLQQDLDVDIRQITGQARTVQLINWQLFPDGNPANSAERVYRRHVLATDASPHLHCCGAFYHLDQDASQPGAVHLTSISSKWLGAYLGLVYKRIVIDSLPWQPLRPLAVMTVDTRVIVRFHVPQPPLAFDTSRVSLAENHGFNVWDATGTFEFLVSAVILSGADELTLQMGYPVPAGSLLRYASKGNRQGRLIGIRGNLRDSQGDQLVFDGGGLNLPMHNWCVAFEEEVHATIA